MLHPGSHLPPQRAKLNRRHDLPRLPHQQGPLVGLFVTCLVDLFRPSVAFAAIKLLEAAGARVEVPRAQTCCGQPAYNSGDRADAMAIARAGGRDFRALRLCGGAVRLMRRHVAAALPAPARRRSRFRRARRGACCQELRADVVSGQRARPQSVDAAYDGKRHLSRFLLVLARAARARGAAAAAVERRRAVAGRARRERSVLRLRRRLLR